MHAIRSVDFFSFTFPTISRQTGRTLEVVSDRKISFCNIKIQKCWMQTKSKLHNAKNKTKKDKKITYNEGNNIKEEAAEH